MEEEKEKRGLGINAYWHPEFSLYKVEIITEVTEEQIKGEDLGFAHYFYLQAPIKEMLIRKDHSIFVTFEGFASCKKEPDKFGNLVLKCKRD
jgi:hypothetical protein